MDVEAPVVFNKCQPRSYNEPMPLGHHSLQWWAMAGLVMMQHTNPHPAPLSKTQLRKHTQTLKSETTEPEPRFPSLARTQNIWPLATQNMWPSATGGAKRAKVD